MNHVKKRKKVSNQVMKSKNSMAVFSQYETRLFKIDANRDLVVMNDLSKQEEAFTTMKKYCLLHEANHVFRHHPNPVYADSCVMYCIIPDGDLESKKLRSQARRLGLTCECMLDDPTGFPQEPLWFQVAYPLATIESTVLIYSECEHVISPQ